MAKINYTQICSKILEILPGKQKEVISRRFGLFASGVSNQGKIKKETLESIGKNLGVTRERIRQIEKDGFLRLKPASRKYQKVFDHFKDALKKTGNLRREKELLLELAGGTNSLNQVYFLLTLANDFERFGETDDFHAFWLVDLKSWRTAQKLINDVCGKFKKSGRPLKPEELKNSTALKPEILASYLAISKKIRQNEEGLFGLSDWPEINPRRIKDKAFLIFKKSQKPLHFTQVAGLIDSALPQTVHNELIKDQRFVLVGRGIYALKEWGYEEGVVKDVISKILKQAGRPLKKEDILEETLKQRLVKKNTVFLNLTDKKYFFKNSDGYYTVKEA